MELVQRGPIFRWRLKIANGVPDGDEVLLCVSGSRQSERGFSSPPAVVDHSLPDLWYAVLSCIHDGGLDAVSGRRQLFHERDREFPSTLAEEPGNILHEEELRSKFRDKAAELEHEIVPHVTVGPDALDRESLTRWTACHQVHGAVADSQLHFAVSRRMP